MYYLDRTPLYEVEKPYSMRYLPEEGIPQTNYKKVKYPLTARSMRRPDVGPFRLNECGFQLVNLDSKLSYDEFWDNKRVQEVYIEEVKDTLKKQLDAKHVFVLDYAVSMGNFAQLRALLTLGSRSGKDTSRSQFPPAKSTSTINQLR
ncbi:hypothetical protein NW767_015015 [Fusarium falciforme]|nr:hypothetical protein NW767_015015 [Fusarium falciforme]